MIYVYLEFFTQGEKLLKNEPQYYSKDFSKKLHWEGDWEEPLIKIAKNYHNGVTSLYISMRYLTIMTISSIEIRETGNPFKN